MGESVKLLFFTYILLAVAIIAVAYIIIRKRNKKKYDDILNDLEREKNLIINASIPTELSKAEKMINSQDIEDKYSEWKNRFRRRSQLFLSRCPQSGRQVRLCNG